MKINKIEKDVPIPTVKSRFDYPWDKMEVGDSVFIEAKGKTFSNLSALSPPPPPILGT